MQENLEVKDLLLENYNFFLPQDLIALNPAVSTEKCKLLVYKNHKVIHTTFNNLFDFIDKKYFIVMNNTKVIRARFFAKKSTMNLESNKASDSIKYKSTKACPRLEDNLESTREFLYHRALDNNLHLVQIKGKVRLGDRFCVDNFNIEVFNVLENGLREIRFFKSKKVKQEAMLTESQVILNNFEVLHFLETFGKIPLPPYIKREVEDKDLLDYQSLFATDLGSIAAPTASLHFDMSMLDFLYANYKYIFLTLHIGAGTFKLVESKNILNHSMHKELCKIDYKDFENLKNAKDILCIGTTALRSVEFLLGNDILSGENNIFLHPQNPPKKVKALLTNFHLPKSSLLMLVSSMIGRSETLKIYHEAIQLKYRFYSYGDCMLILND